MLIACAFSSFLIADSNAISAVLPARRIEVYVAGLLLVVQVSFGASYKKVAVEEHTPRRALAKIPK